MRVEARTPASAAAVAAASDTLAGAAEVARTLPGAVGDAVLVAARGAFTDAIGVLALACGALIAGVAALVWLRLRDLPTLGGEEPAPAGDAVCEAAAAA